MRKLLPVIAIVGALAAAGPSAARTTRPAKARKPHPVAVIRRPGPSFLATGFLGGPDAFEGGTVANAALWYSRARSLHSSWVRLTVVWLALVSPQPASGFRPTDPSDPNYHFAPLDATVREAAAHHERLLLTILDAPSWALDYTSGPTGWNASPKAADVGAFARALALRYSGRYPDPVHPGHKLPRVSWFQAWNEPNLPTMIAPQWRKGRGGKWIPASPSIYRNVLNAVYRNVKAVEPADQVIAAGLAPYGDAPGRPLNRMHPLTFLADLLCLRGPHLRRIQCRNPAHFDVLDVHPYSLTPISTAYNANDISVMDIGRLAPIMRAARRAHTVLPSRPKPIWVTEIGWTSKPPDPHGVPLAVQARYVSLSFFELWSQGVSHVFWDLIRDFPYKSLTGAGVYYQGGVAKPSTRAFRFPFVALPNPLRTVTLWGRAPRRGQVTIQVLRGRRWVRLLRLRTTRGGVFYTIRGLGSRLTLRAVSHGVVSFPYTG